MEPYAGPAPRRCSQWRLQLARRKLQGMAVNADPELESAAPHRLRYDLSASLEDRRPHHHRAGTSRVGSAFPKGYISPNFKALTFKIPAREHRTPTHGRRERY